MSNKTHESFPFIDDIEESLFKAFLQDRKMWVDFYQHVMPDYFNLKEHANIFKVFSAFFEKYKAFPTLAQIENIITKKSYGEATLASSRRIFNASELALKEVQYLYDECAEFIKNNKIKNAILESVELLESGKYDEIEQHIKDATSWKSDVQLGTNMIEVRERFEALKTVVTEVIPSPWPTLNHVLGGGAFAKELTLFASASSVGKSIALDNWATYAWKELKKNVLMITLELSEVRKAQRMDSELTAIKVSDILKFQDEVEEFYNQNKFDTNLYIKEFPTSSVNISNIRQYIYQLELYTGFIPDVIFVDYLDILNPTKIRSDEYQDQGRTGAELRGLGIEKNVPVISATQFSKTSLQVDINELSEYNLAESYKKQMIVDTMIALHNTPEERLNGLINMKTIKARNGVKDVICPMGVDYTTLTIYDPTKKSNAGI